MIGSLQIKSYVRTALRRRGYELVRRNGAGRADELMDMNALEMEIYEQIKPYTMTTIEKVIALVRAVQYVVKNRIAGDFVECGVWRGGSMMAVALALRAAGETDRDLFLYDTFAGMSPPTPQDARYDGATAAELLKAGGPNARVFAYASLEDVTANLTATGYPQERIHYVKGLVEHTVPGTAPAKICMLRLDTDWYESTRHELQHLYPRLSHNGVLIIDDYGHWRGSQQATDEYFSQLHPAPFLNRIDYSGRLAIKPPASPGSGLPADASTGH
ncbi:MAG: TylF/MycF/NovP-related O-methyltransferase [Steroidobacteraceae bacterium]